MSKTKQKKVNITLNAKATRAVLDATKKALKEKSGKTKRVDENKLFLKELEKYVAENGIKDLVDGFSTNVDFHAVVTRGN